MIHILRFKTVHAMAKYIRSGCQNYPIKCVIAKGRSKLVIRGPKLKGSADLKPLQDEKRIKHIFTG
jgi:hypothetical protein